MRRADTPRRFTAGRYHWASTSINAMKDLKEKTIRGGIARLGAQIANLIIRVGSLMVLARLLGPAEFGLVGMVTAFTGVLTLFRDFGLSSAAIQKETVTQEQLSTLFWINLFVGACLTVLLLATAPLIAGFYHQPRLTAVTAILASSFLFNALGIQHGVLLQRELQFTAIAVINTIALTLGAAVGVGLAKAGFGYWALVAMTVIYPLVGSAGFWFATGWIPGKPQRGSGIRSMMHFGGTMTVNGLVVYIASNFEKILLARVWGADAIGLYGRAYQLSNIPTDNLSSAIGEVAFSALSRLQGDPARLRRYFLRGYSVVLALTLPITVACGLYADDIVAVFLGPKWKDAAPIFFFFFPTILTFAIANPMSWLVSALGLVRRGLSMSLAISIPLIGGYLVGLPYGPKGVALAYSAVMVLWAAPVVAWSVYGTGITFQDVFAAAIRPVASIAFAASFALCLRFFYRESLLPLPRLTLDCTILLVAYTLLLLYAMDEKKVYIDLLKGMRKPSSRVEETALVAN